MNATATETEIEKFTVGKDREMDALMAEFDVIGSLAHIKMYNTIYKMSQNLIFGNAEFLSWLLPFSKDIVIQDPVEASPVN